MDTALLIKEAKCGSAAAQKCLFDNWAAKMMMVCRRYVKVIADAEEILLDGFYKFFRTLGKFEYINEAALFSWLKRIMVNECLMFLRKKNSFSIVAETIAEEAPLSQDPLDNLSAVEIFNFIVQLPLGYRTVFNLHVIEGFNHAEIAGLLKITEGASKSQLSRAKALLRKMLLNQGKEYVRSKTK